MCNYVIHHTVKLMLFAIPGQVYKQRQQQQTTTSMLIRSTNGAQIRCLRGGRSGGRTRLSLWQAKLVDNNNSASPADARTHRRASKGKAASQSARRERLLG